VAVAAVSEQEETMKATIHSTDRVVQMDNGSGRTMCRVWEGVSESGVPFTAYNSTCQVARDADNSEFERELSEHKAPTSETLHAIEMRFIL
jgi:hypothetical protein